MKKLNHTVSYLHLEVKMQTRINSLLKSSKAWIQVLNLELQAQDKKKSKVIDNKVVLNKSMSV